MNGRCRLAPVLAIALLAASCATLPGNATAPGAGGWAQVQGTCGTDAAGTAWCWGWDAVAAPMTAVSVGRAFSFAAGTLYQGCALATDGMAWCWGPHLLGGIRLPPAESCGGQWQRPCEVVPTPVSTALRFASLAVGGEHTDRACGIATTGETWCWGRAEAGRLGTTTPDSVCRPYGCFAPPTRIAAPVTFRSVAVGDTHTCALTADGRAFCWGGASQFQLGTPPAESCTALNFDVPCSRTPQEVRGDHRFRELAAGAMHTCGLTTDERVLCWGSNVMGQLGTDEGMETCPVGHMGAPCAPVPVPVAGDFRVSAIGAFHQHTCLLTTDGVPFCWGQGDSGQLGQGTLEQESPYGTRRHPVRVIGNHRFSRLSVAHVVCGLRPDRALYCWGVRSPTRDITAPVPVAPPPSPIVVSFRPRGPLPAAPLLADVRDGRVHLHGRGPARCANNGFHAAASVAGSAIDVVISGTRWLGGGCDHTSDQLGWEAVLEGLPRGTYRIRAAHHFPDEGARVPVGEMVVELR